MYGAGGFPGPGSARGSRLGGGGSSRALAEPPLRRLPLKGASARASAEGLRLSSKIGKNWEAAGDKPLAAQTSPGASLPPPHHPRLHHVSVATAYRGRR